MDTTIIRPDWVPMTAVWVNGFWYNCGIRCMDPANVPALPEARRQRMKDMAEATLAKMREGLPAGHYRVNGLIYGPNGKPAIDLPGGHVDDGSHQLGWAEKRAARIAGIQEAIADEQVAYNGLEEAQQFYDEAVARRFQSHDVLRD